MVASEFTVLYLGGGGRGEPLCLNGRTVKILGVQQGTCTLIQCKYFISSAYVPGQYFGRDHQRSFDELARQVFGILVLVVPAPVFTGRLCYKGISSCPLLCPVVHRYSTIPRQRYTMYDRGTALLCGRYNSVSHLEHLRRTQLFKSLLYKPYHESCEQLETSSKGPLGAISTIDHHNQAIVT